MGESGQQWRRNRRLQTNKNLLRHHTAGLGDGKIHNDDRGRQGADRGPPPILLPGQADIMTGGANRYVRTRDGRSRSHPRTGLSPYDPPDVLDRAAAAGRGGDGKKMAPYESQRNGRQWERVDFASGVPYGDVGVGGVASSVADDGPWQISVLALLGVIAILVALFLHLISDTQASTTTTTTTTKARPHYHFRRTRRPNRSISIQSKKKKFDEPSEDDDSVSDADGSYQADSEAIVVAGGTSASAASKSASPAPLYYPADYHPPQQQHRQRKQASLGAAAGSSKGAHSPTPAHTVIDSHPYYHRTTSGGGAGAARVYAAAGGAGTATATARTPTKPKSTLAQTAVASPTPRRLDESAVASIQRCESSGLGTGLEGFESTSKPPSFALSSAAVDGSTTSASPAPLPMKDGSAEGPGRPSPAADVAPPIVGSPSFNCQQPSYQGDDDRVALEDSSSSSILHRTGAPSPFQSFNSIQSSSEDDSQDAFEQSASSLELDDGPSRIDFRSGSKGGSSTAGGAAAAAVAAAGARDAFGLDNSPHGLIRRRGCGEGKTRQNVTVPSGSCDHDFTPRVDNLKRVVSFAKASGEKVHDSDVESAAEDPLPPPPLYITNEEVKEQEGLSFPGSAVESTRVQAPGVKSVAEEKIQPTYSYSKGESKGASPGCNDRHCLFNGVSLPLIPDLENEKNGRYEEPKVASPHSLTVNDYARPPRSVTLEELHLIKMESGDFDGSSAKWTVATNSVQRAKKGSDVGQESDNAVRPTKTESLKHVAKQHPNYKGNSGRRFVHAETGPSHGKVSGIRGGQDALRGLASPNRNESQHRLMLEIARKSPSKPGAQGCAEPATPIEHKRPDVTDYSDSAASLTLPINFSELHLMSVIGGGGFGQVWKAMWRGTPVAVKILSSSAQTENVPKSVLEEFASEINMVSGMRHPNICLYMGACLDPPNRAIVTEYAAHGSLWDALRSPLEPPYSAADGVSRKAWPLRLLSAPGLDRHDQGWYDGTSETAFPLAPVGAWPWILVKRVALGAARGMTYLHSGKPPVLHRDLKSANLLLDDSYTTKVADFGLSRIKAQERSMTGNCGTVQWMAPEILANQNYAEPADVYAFGIILWELLSRECPFEGMSPIQCALAVLNDNSRPEIPAWVPPSFSALIRVCVDKNPSSRPTFPQILLALEAMP